MIRKLLAAAGIAAAFALPGAAQTFTHTVHGVTHTHDITTYRTVGTCCIQVQTCGCATGHVSHHPHTSNCGSTVTRHYTHAPTTSRVYTSHYSTAPVTRTYTRTYTHTEPPRRIYVEPAPVHPVYEAPSSYNVQRSYDRAEPYANYDRRWKSRTRGGSIYRGHH
ncbi:MAG: hypothetical protein AAGK66_05780 [Pseudomonadota bacterium]